MAYSTLKLGSKGDEVKTLQTQLNANGYNLDVDGSFGNKTLAAVKDYQQKNNLSVDGIVGNNTWGALTKSSTTTPTTTAPAATQQDSTYKYEDFKYDPYEKSDIVKEAEAMIQQQMSQKPGDFQYSFQNQLDDIYNKIMNREEFSYDLNADALYQQYKDQYTAQGQLAMMDTMGQAAAMTGGYGNSYAQGVGQQTYQGYLQQLNEKVPELYQIALNQYNQEEQSLYNQAALLAQQKEQEYGMHRDEVSDYYTALDYLTGRADKLASDEYTQWSDKLGIDYNIHSDRQTAGYQEKSDAFDYAMSLLSSGITPDSEKLASAGISSADAQAIVNKVKEQEAAAKVSSGGGSGNGYDNGGQTTSDIKKMQAELGITADGKWGPASVEASGGLTADEAYTAWMNGTLGEYVDPTGGSEIPESIKNKCASFKSNTELESYLEGLEFAGTISHDQALQLMAEYVDNNEKYIQDGNGNNTSTPSYREMVKNTNGWTVDSKGGANLLGIDQNAKVTAPDGTTMTLKNLREKLKFEGMTQSEANKVIKTLQQNLGISDNWLFGW